MEFNRLPPLWPHLHWALPVTQGFLTTVYFLTVLGYAQDIPIPGFWTFSSPCQGLSLSDVGSSLHFTQVTIPMPSLQSNLFSSSSSQIPPHSHSITPITLLYCPHSLCRYLIIYAYLLFISLLSASLLRCKVHETRNVIYFITVAQAPGKW